MGNRHSSEKANWTICSCVMYLRAGMVQGWVGSPPRPPIGHPDAPLPPDILSARAQVVKVVHGNVHEGVEAEADGVEGLAVLDPPPGHEDDDSVVVDVQREEGRAAALQQLEHRVEELVELGKVVHVGPKAEGTGGWLVGRLAEEEGGPLAPRALHERGDGADEHYGGPRAQDGVVDGLRARASPSTVNIPTKLRRAPGLGACRGPASPRRARTPRRGKARRRRRARWVWRAERVPRRRSPVIERQA